MTPIAKIVENLETEESLPVQNRFSRSVLTNHRNDPPEFNEFLRWSFMFFVALIMYLLVVLLFLPEIFKLNWKIVGLLGGFGILTGFIGVWLHNRHSSSEENQVVNEIDEPAITALDDLQEEIDSFNGVVDKFNAKVEEFASKPDYNLEEMYERCQGFLEFRREYLMITISIFLRKDYKEVLARLEAYHDFVDYFQEMF